MSSVRYNSPYLQEIDASTNIDVINSIQKSPFNGFVMLPGIAKNATEAETEILNKSQPNGPAYAKFYLPNGQDEKTANERLIKKDFLGRKLDKEVTFCNKRVLDYNERLLAKPTEGKTCCVSCKSNISNKYIHKCLQYNKCIVCDGKFQNYTITEERLKAVQDQYNSAPHAYKAVWGGWTRTH